MPNRPTPIPVSKPVARNGVTGHRSGRARRSAFAAGYLVVALGAASDFVPGAASPLALMDGAAPAPFSSGPRSEAPADAGKPRAVVLEASEETPDSAPEATLTGPAAALAARTAELALEEANGALKRKNPDAVRKSGEEARRALLPLVKQVD